MRWLSGLLAAVAAIGLAGSSFAGTYGGGSGTEGDPFQIGTAEHLIDLGETPDDYGKHFIMTADIDLGEYSFTTAVISPDLENDPFSPYGFEGALFTGAFDGDGHKVINLTIDTLADAELDNDNNSWLGLFGKIGGGHVANLGLDNISITSGDGSDLLGGLCGESEYGTITNCYTVTSIITGGDESTLLGILCGLNDGGAIIDSHASGEITGGSFLGGLCGATCCDGTITNCYASGLVMGTAYLGGLCGNNSDATITNCYASSSITGAVIIGGLCGQNEGTISDSNANGVVIGGNHFFDTGGLCGINRGIITTCYTSTSITGGVDSMRIGGLCGNNHGIITKCYAAGEVTGGDYSQYLGGLCGKNSTDISNCYATGEVTGGDYSQPLGGLCGYTATSISNCYATGEVTGGEEVWEFGGLVGDGGPNINCFWDVETSGIGIAFEDNFGATGKTTTQMMQQSTFSDWDFINVWNIGENQTYPYLRTVLASDINKDKAVNLLDLSILAGQWMGE